MIMGIRHNGGARRGRSVGIAGRSALALTVAVFSLVVAPSAFAGLALGVGPTFPTPVAVGQTNVPASLQLSNVSTPPESGGTVSVTQIMLVPACGSSDPSTGDCPLAQADPGVFTLSPTATGEAGTACQGINFAVTVTDPATGQVQFVPVGGAAVVLTAPGTPNSVCRIDFTVSVNAAPVHPNTMLGPNSLRTYVLARVIASPSTAPAPAPETGNQPVLVNKAAPGLTTTATPTAPAGQPITDTAHLTAATPPGPAPTGTITFNLYATAGCGGVPVFTSTVPVSGVGDYTSAPPFTPTAPGSYFWTAAYSGDVSNAAVTTACGDNNETTMVTKAAPAIVTVASGPGPTITDRATLSGGVNPTGSIVFTLFGPDDATCARPAIFTSTVPVNAGNGGYTSGAFTVTAPGTYRWVAAYSGDAANTAVTSPCNAANEAVSLPTPVIAVTKAASPASRVVPGGDFTFTVQVSNPSAVDPIRITTLVDNIYGDLASRPGSTCNALIGVTLAPGASSAPCTFTGPFSGVAGASQTDTVTVNGVDSNGLTAQATAQATVTLTPLGTPVIAVTKAASPPSRPEPGGDFTFTVAVSNPSATTPVTITRLVDNIYGDLTATSAKISATTCANLIGVTLQPGASSAPCSFTGAFSGVSGASQTDTVTVTGMNNGITVTATAMATVTLTPAPAGPQIAVTKAASPASRVAPGGDFTFTATVSNPSTTTPVTITKLVDNIYGDLATRPGSSCGTLIGVTLAPGAKSPACSFTGPFSGSSGASQTDTITVTGMNNGQTVTATAQATVTLTPPSAPGSVVSPVSLHGPAACVTTQFKIYVTGLSVARVTYYLDGKRLGSVSKRDGQGHLSITIRPAGLSKGKLHRLTAVTEPVAHSGQPVRTVRRTFAVCAKPTLPRFTG
ncbi:MAG: hypothetical protein QOF77_293 [Solirubrobacteraceae bacterium]|nr:hypothetical protein [Solirubrobacteraceae bacterium]